MIVTTTLFDHLQGDFDARPDVVIDSAGRGLSGAEIRSQAHRMARLISADGPSCVALLADNGSDWIIADLACQIAGAALLPIPGFFTPDQARHAIIRAGADMLLIDNGAHGRWPALARCLATIFTPHTDVGGIQVCASTSAPAPRAPALPQGTGKVTFTSGSTGTPRGVCLSNSQLIRQAEVLTRQVGLKAPKHLSLLPLSVLLENIAGVYTALLAGGSVIVPDQRSLGFTGSSGVDISALLDNIVHHQPNSLILIPQLLNVLVTGVENGWQAPPSLQFIAVGGSRVSAPLVLRARDLGLPVYEGYGLSECASVVALNTPAADCPGSAGKPLPHLDVSIADGEVVVEGNPFLGYVGDQASWYPKKIPTGDLGHLDAEGFLHLDGRRKNLLISSFGRNISPEWIESELSNSALIRDCIVFGDARPWLCALIHPSHGGISDSDIHQWIDRVNRTLPDYGRIVRWLRLEKPLAASPGLLTATGKPRREAIFHRFQATIDRLYDSEYAPIEAVYP